MATLWITEYSDIAESFGGKPVLVGREPSLTVQSVSYTTTAQSNNFHPKTRFIRVKADADAYLEFGQNPTATVASTAVEADVAEYFGVEIIRNQNIKLAVYDGSS